LESSHALAWALAGAKSLKPGSRVLVCLSGRGDKDLSIVAEAMRSKSKTTEAAR
jgi:tryptophan synthase beta subunit